MRILTYKVTEYALCGIAIILYHKFFRIAINFTYFSNKCRQNKNPPIRKTSGEKIQLFSGIELLSKLSLLSCSLILMHKTLSASLVNLLDSELYSLCLISSACCASNVSLLEDCLEVCLS